MSLKSALSDITRKHGMALVDEDYDIYGATLLYQNRATGLRCAHSPKEGGGWIVVIGKLKNGCFPKHPIHIDDSTNIDRFNIRDLASLRLKYLPDILRKKIEHNLELLPKNIDELLKNCCGALLDGNFAAFEPASVIVKKRAKRLAKEYPKK